MAHKPATTSWANVADWYDGHLSGPGTYHETVVAPNIVRMLELKQTDAVLDIACGTGYFTRLIAPLVKEATGVDLGPSLIEKAKDHALKNTTFVVGNAETLEGIKDEHYTKAVCVLALQNIEQLTKAAQSAARVLKPGGLWCVVLNHPCFRIPDHSAWYFNETLNTQLRQLTSYMTEFEKKMDMNPGARKLGDKHFTLTFHRPLQTYTKAFTNAGFAITRLEEWISPKVSQEGPRKDAEDTARKEFPLFMAMVLKKM